MTTSSQLASGARGERPPLAQIPPCQCATLAHGGSRTARKPCCSRAEVETRANTAAVGDHQLNNRQQTAAGNQSGLQPCRVSTQSGRHCIGRVDTKKCAHRRSFTGFMQHQSTAPGLQHDQSAVPLLCARPHANVHTQHCSARLSVVSDINDGHSPTAGPYLAQCRALEAVRGSCRRPRSPSPVWH